MDGSTYKGRSMRESLNSVGMKNRNWVALAKGKSDERIGVRSAEPSIQRRPANSCRTFPPSDCHMGSSDASSFPGDDFIHPPFP